MGQNETGVDIAYLAIRMNQHIEKARLAFERKKHEDEMKEREDMAAVRQYERQKVSDLSSELAESVSRRLADDPHWAAAALEAAKFLPYQDTLFGERAGHFKAEKEELARVFCPHLLSRCRSIIETTDRDVYVAIDAGTTLLPFFRIIGVETVRAAQQGGQEAEWLNRFHLVTNSLPGVEELMRTGRRTQYDRYAKLAIDCELLPGAPIPLFAAVAGDQTEEAIARLRARVGGPERAVVMAVVVGNWVRIRRSSPRCPVPMARGKEHLGVKNALIRNADEVFVVSPLGKVFVGHSNAEVNQALGFAGGRGIEREPYAEALIDDDLARRVKLLSTCRPEGRILCRHSHALEDALGAVVGEDIDGERFAQTAIQDLPHYLVPFIHLPANPALEFEEEFPHFHTRLTHVFLDMFRATTAPSTKAD
jgi:hypothetical protein